MPKEIRKNGQNPVFWTFWSPLFKNQKTKNTLISESFHFKIFFLK